MIAQTTTPATAHPAGALYADTPLDITDPDRMWSIFAERDSRYDGKIFIAVRTTKIYCRPRCPARAPKRENVRFYLTRERAEAAGYRACKRCKPDQVVTDPRLATVEAACRHVAAHLDDELAVDEVASAVGHSAASLQRLFREVTGVALASYVRGQRMDRLRHGLKGRSDVTFAIYDAGFSSSSRVYERADRELGMTPATYRAGAAGQTVRVVVSGSPLGQVLVARTDNGICAVRLGDDADALRAELIAEFPNAEMVEGDDGSIVREVVDTVVRGTAIPDLHLDVRGTIFQRRVWEELRRIPRGETRTYAQVAEAIGRPSAVRAVANACAQNQAALVIPCHRVVRTDGGVGGYRWGAERKQAILAAEAG